MKNPKLIVEPAKVRGYRFLLDSKKLSSSYDPIKESENILVKYRDRLNQIDGEGEVIALGFFPIYHLKLVNKINPQLKLRIVEENINQECLKRAWKIVNKDSSIPINKNKHQSNIYQPKKRYSFPIIFHQNVETVINYLNKMNSKMLKKVILLPSPYCSKEVVSRVFKVYQELHQKVLIEEKTTDHFNILWNLHTLSNLKQNKGYMINSHKWIDRGNLDRVAFLVSSGPSLDNALKQHQNEIIQLAKNYPFIAVPGIACRLIDIGIPLTAIFSTDAGFLNTYHFSKLFNHHNTLPLIIPLSIHPSIIRNWKNIFFYWDLEEHGDFFTQTIGKENFIPADASVVLSGIRLLTHLGCRRIYTIGIDFAITPFQEHALSNITQEILFNQNRRLSNYTTAIHKLFHKQSIIKPFIHHKSGDQLWYQSQALQLYYKQFNKIKDYLEQKGIKIQSINTLSWQDYLKNSGSSLIFRNQSYPLKQINLRKIYEHIRNHFKNQMFTDSIKGILNNNSDPSSKETWLNKRWANL